MLQEIEESRIIHPDGGPLRMSFVPYGFNGSQLELLLKIRDRSAIIQKLISLEAIRMITVQRGTDGSWIFAPDKKYEQIFNEYDQLYSDEAEQYEIAKAQKSSVIEEMKSIRYDPLDHTLLLGSHVIRLKKGDSNQSELCRVIFKNKDLINKSWSSDEMLEEWGWHENRIYDKTGKLLSKNRRVVYTAANGINDLALKATQGKVSDLFTYTTKAVSLTEKYREFVS